MLREKRRRRERPSVTDTARSLTSPLNSVCEGGLNVRRGMFCCIISIPLVWDVSTQLPSLILITITPLIAGDCSLTTVQLRQGEEAFC